jgi:F-type H+-transporting ATPase subunit alpha
VAGDLRLSYSQFEELERFSRFGTRLDEQTRKTLAHGHRVREILKQGQHQPIPVPEQIAALLAVSEGVLDEVPVSEVREKEQIIAEKTQKELSDLCERMAAGEKIREEDHDALIELARNALTEDQDAKSTENEKPD